MSGRHKRDAKTFWTIFAVAAVLALVVIPLGPDKGTLANLLFLVQALLALVGLIALGVAIRKSVTRR